MTWLKHWALITVILLAVLRVAESAYAVYKSKGKITLVKILLEIFKFG